MKRALIRSSRAAFLRSVMRPRRVTLLESSPPRALSNGLLSEACSGESVTLRERSKTRMEPRSMEMMCLALTEAEKEATIRRRRRRSGPPKTTSRAARLARKVMKNCFIDRDWSLYLKAEEGKDNGFAPERG